MLDAPVTEGRRGPDRGRIFPCRERPAASEQDEERPGESVHAPPRSQDLPLGDDCTEARHLTALPTAASARSHSRRAFDSTDSVSLRWRTSSTISASVLPATMRSWIDVRRVVTSASNGGATRMWHVWFADIRVLRWVVV